MISDSLWDRMMGGICVNTEGVMVFDPSIERWWTENGEDFDLLLRCIEDNIVLDEETGEEVIDWALVEADYEEDREVLNG